MAQHFEPRQRLSLAHSLPTRPSSSSSPLQQVQHGGDAQQQQYRLQYATPPVSSYQVLRYDPQHGAEGTTVTVSLQTSYQAKQLKLGFGSLVVDTRQYDNRDHVSLYAIVPSFSLTKSYSNKVDVSVIVLDIETDTVIARLPLGDFTYESSARNDRKRVPEAAAAAIYDPDFYAAPGGEGPSKRLNLEMTRPKEEESYLLNPANYSSYYQTSPVMANPYTGTMQMQQRGFLGDVSSMYGYNAQAQYMYTSTATSAASTPAMTGLGLGIGDFAGNTAANASTHLSPLPAVSSAYLPHTSGTESASIVAAVADDVSPVGPGTVAYPSNPYASLLNKANLKIQGAMEDMAVNWTPEEWDNRRRLVQFWRRQEGNDIFCTFAPVAASERQPNSIVVSCIYWHEKGDCYITSVDTIMLLESLIGVRFTVEEKNRIRRNLEGFRPITVSKCKPESAEFFKLIMSFPNPKPRNIEKDVKVFPWNVLTHALKKIISKYTASYSSTASVNVEAIQNAAYPANLPSSSSLPTSDPYGSTTEATSPADSNPLPVSPHVVASQGAHAGSVSPLPSQQQGGRGAYHHQQQPQQQQAYDSLSAYGTSPHSHGHHHTQYTYGYRHLSPYSTNAATTAEHIGYEDDFQSGASHGGSHGSTPHTLSSWEAANE